MRKTIIVIDPRAGSVHVTTELIGHFSIDSDLQYRADLSQLKYYIPPLDPDNVNFDLNINCTSARDKPTSYIRFENILRWIWDNFHRIERPLSEQEQDEERWLDIDFICSRGIIRKLLCEPYAKMSDEWIICASKYRGTIYLCEFCPDARERGQDNAVVENQISSKINKFQQYIVADHPLHEPDSSVPLNESEEFHCMFKANFAGISLLYDAKIDAISSQQLITDTLIGKPFESIGLKMFQMRIRHMRSTPGIISKCWSTNFLANANRIVVGFRDATNTVKVIKEYSMADLLRLSKPYCDVELCKTYLTVVLKTIKQSVTKDYNKCIYKFHRQPVKETNKEVFLLELTEEAPNNEMYLFLKPWFVAKAEEYRRTQQR
ncbi:decapping and exoribonuclease protein-like [Temnothorax longispinosus]|uniref:decapping and exoribonuclease protein-like n=1 Tax=Temnothorax longispinosus TaxID=300112 RepID=UPI003A998761